MSVMGASVVAPPTHHLRRPQHVGGDDSTAADSVGATSGTERPESDRRVVLRRGAEQRPGENDQDRRHRAAAPDQTGEATGRRATATGADDDGTAADASGDREAATGASGDSEAATGASGDREDATEPNELTTEEEQVVREMKSRDREVRSHEMAHVAAGGAHVTGGPSYSYQSGPDGRRYAVGGEVSIDTSPEDDPQATITKMMQVRSAALAPAEPSGADRAVAASAAQQAAQARAELAQQRLEGTEGDNKGGETGQHRHAGGGVCPDCVGARYGASDQQRPSPTVSVAA